MTEVGGQIGEIQRLLREFARQRNWEPYHTPRNLAALIASEAGELLALYRWDEKVDVGQEPEVAAEVADVFLGVLRFADVTGIDLLEAARVKIRRNAEKYPVEDGRRMALSFPLKDAAAVRSLAGQYWDLITPADREIEKGLEVRIAGSRIAGYLDRQAFIDIARWKSPRNDRHYRKNTAEAIEHATRRAFQEDMASAIGALTGLKGVGLRTATALLHWMRPEEFPVLDVRIVRALDRATPRSWEDTAFYSAVAEQCRAIAARLGVDLRTLDRALWAWDKLHPPP